MRSLILLLPLVCLAQSPAVGIIQIYGNSTVPAAEIRKVLGITEGDPLPKSKGELEERLAALDSVVTAHLEAACCDEGKAILYVGVEERGAPHFDYHAEPAAEGVTLPDTVVAAYRSFVDAARNAAREGTASEDLSAGHSLLADPKARYLQLGFTALADEHRGTLGAVLRESSNSEHRAIAAYVLGYATDKQAVQDDLQYAIRDSDETVRANALRALAAFAVFSQKNPDARLKVSPTWMIEMLNSLVWTDRNNAAVALVTLTETRDAGMLEQIRARALGSILEMGSWVHLPHALPGFILAGRLAGMPEKEIQAAWNAESREEVLSRAAGERR